LVSKIDLVIQEIKKPRNEKAFAIFQNRIKVLDDFRNINYKDYIPELEL